MMKLDLAAARKKWIAEGKTDEEHERREKSDFLLYRNSAGRYADFHATWHPFISNLSRCGVRPKLAQTLARHSDINDLTSQATQLREQSVIRGWGQDDQRNVLARNSLRLLAVPKKRAAEQLRCIPRFH